MSSFCLKSYDIFNFDLDHTLCQYNIRHLYNSQNYYLNHKLKKYNRKLYGELHTKLQNEDYSFISRGLFIDYERGNLLKLNRFGEILRASHGTTMLTKGKIARLYGSDRKWSSFTEAMSNPLNFSKKATLKTMFPLMDFSTSSLSFVFAQAIDAVEESKKPIALANNDFQNAVSSMLNCKSSWTNNIYSDLKAYTFQQDDAVVKWIKMLKSVTYTSMITNKDRLFAQKEAARALGENWKDLFDFIIYSSNKPTFFTGNNPFYGTDTTKYPHRVQFSLEGEYKGGCYSTIENALASKLGRQPRSVYFGDNLLEDFAAAPEAVAIVEETVAEKLIPFFSPNKDLLISSHWGSVIFEKSMPTWFGDIVMKSKFCAPSLGYFARLPFNYEYENVVIK